MEKYKKYIQLGVILIVAVWVFCIVFVVSVKSSRKNAPTAAAPTTTAAQIATMAPSTTEEQTQTTAPSTTSPKVSIDGNNVTTSVDTSTPQWKLDEESKAAQTTAPQSESAPIPTEKKDIVDTYVAAVNKLKQTEKFNLTKTPTLSVSIDSVSGGSVVRSMAQKIIDQNSDNTPKTFSFSAGKAADGSTPNSVIAPMNQAAVLSASDVVSASSKKGKNGSFTLTINLGKAKQTLDSVPTSYSGVTDVLTTEAMGLSGMNISSMDITYANSYIKATLDSNGRITSMTHYIEVTNGSGSGKLALISAQVSMHGSLKTDYKITY